MQYNTVLFKWCYYYLWLWFTYIEQWHMLMSWHIANISKPASWDRGFIASSTPIVCWSTVCHSIRVWHCNLEFLYLLHNYCFRPRTGIHIYWTVAYVNELAHCQHFKTCLIVIGYDRGIIVSSTPIVCWSTVCHITLVWHWYLAFLYLLHNYCFR